MELNEYWSAQMIEEYKGMLHEQKMLAMNLIEFVWRDKI